MRYWREELYYIQRGTYLCQKDLECEIARLIRQNQRTFNVMGAQQQFTFLPLLGNYDEIMM